jgi:metal-responsive CopG/Arc/MetJ family transcriptional regulator
MATRTLNISLSEELIQRADKYAAKQHANRSELIRAALDAYLKKREEWDDICAVGREYGRRSGIQEGDVAGIVRTYRTKGRRT